MPSNYVGDPATAVTTLSLPTAGDARTVSSFRVPLERLADGVAKALQTTQGAGADNSGGATITLGAGHVFNLITSTTAITAFAYTDDVVGRSVIIRFNTARTLTHNATTLVIPGGANITTAAGDVMQITRTTAGFRVDWYTRAARVPGASASDTVEGVLEIATQAEQETATDVVRAVTPGRQHFHPSAAKFWAHVPVTAGAPAIAASYNVTSVTDLGVGQLTVTLTTGFSGGFWALIPTAEALGQRTVQVTSRGGSSANLSCTDLSGVSTDPSAWNVVGYGDHS